MVCQNLLNCKLREREMWHMLSNWSQFSPFALFHILEHSDWSVLSAFASPRAWYIASMNPDPHPQHTQPSDSHPAATLMVCCIIPASCPCSSLSRPFYRSLTPTHPPHPPHRAEILKITSTTSWPAFCRLFSPMLPPFVIRRNRMILLK